MSNFMPSDHDLRTANFLLPSAEKCSRIASNACRSIRWQCSELQDQEGLTYYELLKPSEAVNTDRYKQQLLNLNDAILEKREQYKKRKHKVIFLNDNEPSHRTKQTKDIVKVLG
ncbi:mariner Mos1 transposase [Trichonephila clavipes]|nr:mariner Mos1 transposase [Trichonephila clavipes]